tara:strand:- start:57 stop:611 length:555 start_codon:yes stop_codon:yes gene_type:complete
MFNPSLTPLAQLHENLIAGTLTISRHSVDAFERFSKLQMQAMKATFEETGERMSALISAANPQEVNTVLHDWIAPSGEKFQSWVDHVQTISTETGTELAKDWEKQFAGDGSSLQAALESAANDPMAGAQGFFPWMLPADVKKAETTSSEQSSNDSNAVSGRARSKDVKQVKRTATRPLASPDKL